MVRQMMRVDDTIALPNVLPNVSPNVFCPALKSSPAAATIALASSTKDRPVSLDFSFN